MKLLSHPAFWLGQSACCSSGLLRQTGSLCSQETHLPSLPAHQPVCKMLLVSAGVLHTERAPSILVEVPEVASCRGTTGPPSAALGSNGKQQSRHWFGEYSHG